MVNLVKKLLGMNPQKKVPNNNSLLIVGLWNPDAKYTKTRHNIGADTLSRQLEKLNASFKLHKSGRYQSAEISIGCLLYTSPSPRDKRQSRMPSSA